MYLSLHNRRCNRTVNLLPFFSRTLPTYERMFVSCVLRRLYCGKNDFVFQNCLYNISRLTRRNAHVYVSYSIKTVIINLRRLPEMRYLFLTLSPSFFFFP